MSAAFEGALPVAAISFLALGAHPASPKAASAPAAVAPFRKCRREHAVPIFALVSPAIFSMVMILSFSFSLGSTTEQTIRLAWGFSHRPDGLNPTTQKG